MFAFVVVLNPTMMEKVGFDSSSPHLTTALTSLFVHANLLHLLGNMVFLAAVGPAVEAAAGTLRFACVYLLGGLIGVLAHFGLSAKIGGAPPLVGASGCISACIAYYSLRYMNLKVPIAPRVGVPLPAIVGVWIVLQLGGAFIAIGEPTATSYWAHLGGFLCGLVLGMVFGAPKLAQVDLGYDALDRLNARGPSAQLQAADHYLRNHPSDIKALRERAQALVTLGDRGKAAGAYVNLLDVLPESQQLEPLKELVKLGGLGLLPSLRRSLLADRFKEEDPTLARTILQSIVDAGKDEPQRPDALVALFDLLAPDGPVQGLMDILAHDYPLHPATELARRRGWIQ